MDRLGEKPPTMAETDWDCLHYAVGLLVGIAMKHGVIDVSIYYNSLHVRIEHIEQEK